MINKLLPLFFIFVVGCQGDIHDRENYGDLGQNPASIPLSNANQHKGGYGRSDCLLCHNVALNVHRRPGNNIDVDTLNEKILNNGGSQYCITCHTDNGLSK